MQRAVWAPVRDFYKKNAFAAYLVRPQAGETSHKKQLSCGRARERLSLLFPFRGGFRLCGGDQRAFRSPFGNLRGFLCCEWRGAAWNSFLVEGQGNPLPLYQYPKRANPLFPSRRAGKSIPLDAITFPFQRASVPPLHPEADPPRRTPERGHTPSRQLPQARASARTAAPPPR